jgi:predicted small metal-binding protein
MTFSLSCGDVMPGCAARFVADSEDDLFAQVAPHAETAHGIVEFTPDIIEAVRSKISTS